MQSVRMDHPLILVVEKYFHGCNTADADLMIACFTDDVHAYWYDEPALTDSRSLASFWCQLHEATGARWTIDRGVASAGEAVIEWSMLWTPPGYTTEDLWRGTDWFIFRAELICEIRQYHPILGLKPGNDAEMMNFPYAARGYPTKEKLDDQLC